MLANIINQMFLYQRPTVDKSISIAVTDTVASTEFFEPGLWVVHNLGPNIAYVRMFTSATPEAALTDMPVFPYGSQDMSHFFVEIGMIDRKLKASGLGHPPDQKFLSALCGSGETATLRATRLTKN